MIRSLRLGLLAALVCAVPAAPGAADDPPKRPTEAEKQELFTKLVEFCKAGQMARQNAKLPEAVKAFEDALKTAREVFNPIDYPDGHADLATVMNNLALLYEDQGQVAKAENLYKEALAMYRRVFKGDHPAVAQTLNNLAALRQSQGNFPEAEMLYADVLVMRNRLLKGDHPDVAQTLNNLATLHERQGKFGEAERGYKDAISVYKRHFKGDHVDIATALNNLANLYHRQGRFSDAESLAKDSLSMLKRLIDTAHPFVARGLNNLAGIYHTQGKLAEAAVLYKSATEMLIQLYKGDHPFVASSLNNLAELYKSQGRVAESEPLLKDALAMRKRLFKEGHPLVALSLNNLAMLYMDQGKLADAQSLLSQAVDIYGRVFKGDHPDVATSLNNLALAHRMQKQFVEAEALYKRALAMRQRLFSGGHLAVALSAHNLAALYLTQGKLAQAEPLLNEALIVSKKHANGDHPWTANLLNSLAILAKDQRKLAEAQALFEDALAMKRRLFTSDHPDVALGLMNLGEVCSERSKFVPAARFQRDALAMYQRLSCKYARLKSEGEALTFVATRPHLLDSFLSTARMRGSADPGYDRGRSYAAVWTTKGTLARVFEQRHQRARAATDLTAKVARLLDARRRRADLVFALPTKDPATLKQRETDLRALDDAIATLTRELAAELPASARADKLDAATLADFQKALPPDAALVDCIRYVQFGWDDTRPAGQTETRTERYVAFVVTRDTVTWVDLDTAAAIEPAVEAWRAAITSGKEIDAKVPAKVRTLVWEPVRKHLPANTKTVFVCPDAALCTLPFAALPGDKPGTVLLEDFALATVPHAPFLLDQLWPQDPPTSKTAGALVVGGVNFDAQVVGSKVAEPLVKPDAKRGWGALPNTVGELNGIGRLAAEKTYAVTRLEGDKATTAAVLDALPKAQLAHFATHGFFADPSFRGVFQLDEKDFRQSLMGERIGRVANNPLLMTGLVCAGANTEGTPGRGILTGDALIDRDLSGLELAVLSACETGLGDLGAGGEGVFGLQRAFHYAGAKNVIVSLWKVPDAPTAALMNRFYTNLWEKNLPPLEALRQAQLHIYRNPGDIPELAKGFRGKFEEVKGAGDIAVKPQGGKAHPLHWAAFSLSGTGK